MEIWIQQDEDRLRLPVLPSAIEAGSTSNNQTINIDSRGEIMLLGREDLRTMTIESFFPNQEYYFNEYSNPPKPWSLVSKILTWKASREPIRVIVTGTLLNVEMGIENFVYGERDGSGDVYYSLDLKDYRRLKARSRGTSSSKNKTKTNRPVKKPKSKTYKVKRGDNLWNIAKKHTGNAMNYKKIAKDNNIKNPNAIKVGQVIKL